MDDPDELTREERLAIGRLKRAFASFPKSLVLYAIDDTAEVCKRGVSSDDICEYIGKGVAAGNMLTDIHDDMDNGLFS